MYLKVYVSPDARRESVRKVKEALHISVKEPAKGNRANTRLRELVAAHFKVPVNHVRILGGHHSRSKMLSIDT